jgi:hypothetical protein
MVVGYVGPACLRPPAVAGDRGSHSIRVVTIDVSDGCQCTTTRQLAADGLADPRASATTATF